MMTSAAELLASLERAEAPIGTETQWCRGKKRSADGRRCLIGALKAAGYAEQPVPVVLRAAKRLKGFPYPRVDPFSDDLLTSHHHVIAALAEARREIGGAPGRGRAFEANEPLLPAQRASGLLRPAAFEGGP